MEFRGLNCFLLGAAQSVVGQKEKCCLSHAVKQIHICGRGPEYLRVVLKTLNQNDSS